MGGADDRVSADADAGRSAPASRTPASSRRTSQSLPIIFNFNYAFDTANYDEVLDRTTG
ncbi:hypothetical protein [Streptomyces sp. NPDC093261]|uniref:hypothetical protein n=1 Tax=Streptomyces sp. NPDC093261 TaxID=3366037 RepID=UPI00381CDCCB